MTFVNDPIADFLIRIKNAGLVGKTSIEVPYSKMKHAIAEALERAGFISGVEKEGKGVNKTLIVKLSYTESGVAKIKDVKRVSKPGRRLYRKLKEIFPVRYGRGVAMYTTPLGVLTDKEAREKKVGGEILFEIY